MIYILLAFFLKMLFAPHTTHICQLRCLLIIILWWHCNHSHISCVLNLFYFSFWGIIKGWQYVKVYNDCFWHILVYKGGKCGKVWTNVEKWHHNIEFNAHVQGPHHTVLSPVVHSPFSASFMLIKQAVFVHVDKLLCIVHHSEN